MSCKRVIPSEPPELHVSSSCSPLRTRHSPTCQSLPQALKPWPSPLLEILSPVKVAYKKSMKSSSLSSSLFVRIIRNSHSQFLRRSISSVIRQKQYLIRPRSVVLPVREMASNQQGQSREELDAKARHGETVVPGGTGGTSLEAQEHLAEGRSRGGQTRKEQLGKEGYQEMGRKGGLSTGRESGEELAQREGVPVDESKFTTKR